MVQRPLVPGRWALGAVWCTAALVLTALVAADRVTRSAGDDRDPAWQRPGILDLGELPVPAPDLPGADLPAGRAAVVFFAAGDRLDRLCSALARWSRPEDVTAVVVTSASGSCPDDVVTVDADGSAVADAYGLRRPGGDVDATGYAIVDERGRIRYRTLDPLAAELLDEVSTMVRAL